VKIKKTLFFILIILLAILLTEYVINNSNNQSMNQSQNYTVLTTTDNIPFNIGDSQKYKPSDEDIKNGLQILENNLRKNTDLLNLAEYKIQFFGYINNEGEKILFANHFCRDSGIDWKNNWVGVDGGGNCFFEIKVNLDKEEVFDLKINSII